MSAPRGPVCGWLWVRCLDCRTVWKEACRDILSPSRVDCPNRCDHGGNTEVWKRAEADLERDSSGNLRSHQIEILPAVLVDDPVHAYGRMIMCHMMSKDLNALHEMADKIGVARKWFQNKPGGTPHYDICKSKRALAIRYGAVESDRHGIVEVIRHFRKTG